MERAEELTLQEVPRATMEESVVCETITDHQKQKSKTKVRDVEAEGDGE